MNQPYKSNMILKWGKIGRKFLFFSSYFYAFKNKIF